MTLKKAITIEYGDEVQDNVTGEILNVVGVEKTRDGRSIDFILSDDNGNKVTLNYKEISFRKKREEVTIPYYRRKFTV